MNQECELINTKTGKSAGTYTFTSTPQNGDRIIIAEVRYSIQRVWDTEGALHLELTEAYKSGVRQVSVVQEAETMENCTGVKLGRIG